MRAAHGSIPAVFKTRWLLFLAVFLLPLVLSQCPTSSVVTDHVYGSPEYGCCHYATLSRVLCNPSGPAVADTAQGTAGCEELSAAAANVDLQWTEVTWQACDIECQSDPACQLWSFRRSQRGIGNRWLPAVCSLITENLQCSAAWCKSPGSSWGTKNCSAASLVAAANSGANSTGGNVTAAPMCEVPSPRPPVKGVRKGADFELEAGCRHRLWNNSAVTECHRGTWVVIVGGSNAILMSIQLANTFAPGTLHPTLTNSRTFDTSFNDVVFEDGAAIYNHGRQVIPTDAWDWSSYEGALDTELARAPAYSANRIRLTLLIGQYWPNVDSAWRVINANENWKGARDAQSVTMVTQISQWYLVCGIYRLGFCNRRALMAYTSNMLWDLYRTEMEASLTQMKPYCAPGGPAGRLGCTVTTNAFDPGQVARLTEINGIISSVMEIHQTTRLRYVNMFEFGEGAPTESVAAHSTPMLILSFWQVVFGTVCTLAGANYMTEPFAKFVGDTCFAQQTPGSMSTCPAYMSTCGSRCERWECMHGPQCSLEGSMFPSVQEEDSCISTRGVRVSFLNGEPAAGTSSSAASSGTTCRRVWCDDELKVILPILGVLGVIGAIGVAVYKAGCQGSKEPPPAATVGGTVVGVSAEGSTVIRVGEKDGEPPAGSSMEAANSNSKNAPDIETAPPQLDGTMAKVADKEGPKPRTDDRFPLGFARFLASLHIVAGHMYQQGSISDVYFYGWGFSWVPWFFMLSGFVLFSANYKRPTKENPLEYVRRRSVTIWPLYAVSLIPMLILSKVVYSYETPGGGYLLAQTLLVQSWVPWLTENVLQVHCWFLSCMVVYWLCFKPLYRCVSSFGIGACCGLLLTIFVLPWLVAVVIPAAAGDVEWYKEHTEGSTEKFEDIAVIFLKFHPFSYFHVFLAGMLLAQLRLCLGKSSRVSAFRIPMELLVPFCYLVMILLFAIEDIKPWGFKLSARLSILLPLQSGILLGFAGLPNIPLPLMSWLALKVEFLADYSYAVYIFQFFCYRLWPTHEVDIRYFIFLIGTACAMVHLVQRPVQTLWKKLPWYLCLAIPLLLGAVLLGLSFIDDAEKPSKNSTISRPAGPAEVTYGDGRVDVLMNLTFPTTEALINPSMIIVGNKMIVAARLHTRTWTQEAGIYQGESVTIVNELWHSDILFGEATVTTNPPALPTISLSRWEGLRNAAGHEWKELCYKDKYIPENKTLVRKVLTGPEDPRLIAYGGGAALSFNSVPPLGFYGCQPGGAVSQMYLAPQITPTSATSLVTARRIKCGFTRVDEKNWIPFTRHGKLHFIYEPQPQEVAVVRDDGSCQKLYSTSFSPLQKLLTDHPRWRIRGSGQAVYVDKNSPTLSNTPHYLAMLHIFDLDTGMYAHFAYRFNPDPPFEIWQVSEELELLTNRSDLGGAAFAFVSGLSLYQDSVAISYGAGDQESRTLIMPLTKIDEYFPQCYIFRNYNLVTRKRGWQSARDHCRANGGDLVSFDNEEEMLYVVTKLMPPEGTWFGLNRLQDSGWRWPDGSTPTFFNWNPDEPTGRSWLGEEKCVGLTSDLGWWDAPCFWELQFICEGGTR